MPKKTNRRIFTFEEACRLLPEIRERTDRALREIREMDVAFDGDEEDTSGTEPSETEADRVLLAWARDIEALGIEVKGPWLVDFDSGAGYYCWRWPEESLEYFHGYDEGFTGRIRLQ